MRFVLAVVVMFVASALRADDTWPQFRGPDGQGHATSNGPLPVTFGEQENVVWKTPLPGEGWSSVVGDMHMLWMTTAIKLSEESVSLHALGVDTVSGKLVHDIEVLPPVAAVHLNLKNSHASPTPVLENDRLYMHFGTYGSACLDTSSAKVLWTNTDVKLDHKEGPGSSPLIYKNLMIFNCDGMDVQFVVALDKNTGKEVWRTSRTGEMAPDGDQRKAYCTPLIIHVNDRDELISPGAWQVISYDPMTGAELWKVRYPPGFSNVPRPLYVDGVLYICSGFSKTTLLAIKPGVTGDVTETNVLWRFPKQVPRNPTPVYVDGDLYMIDDKGIATCVDAGKGEARWTERIGGNFSASPLYADGRLYFSSEEGKVYVIEPAREYKLLATNVLDGRLMSSPAVLGKAMFFRTDKALYRIESRGQLAERGQN
jgi:outer membrane protein assembly factor BamB